VSTKPESSTKNYPELIADFYLGRKSTSWRPKNLDEFRRSVSQDDILLIPKGKFVLDAGAGNGYFSRLLHDAGNSVICLEVVEELLERCRENGLEALMQADLNKSLPFPDNTFDMVFSRTVIEHLFNPWSFFAEAHRILRPGGQFIVTTPNKSHVMMRASYALGRQSLNHDVKDFTSHNLHQLLQDSGFEATVKPFLGRHPIARLLRRVWTDFSPAIVGIGSKRQ
jgi:2-polyprenyl-3-methyl-5-hydroxy-6-metoxy-1,4-benzoquinol methylase